MKRLVKFGGCLLLLLLAKAAIAQVKIGDDLSMRMGGTLTAGYSADYGNQIPSDHSLDFGADAEMTGDYYNPNFLNFTISPYYNRSSANSTFSSLTNASGVNAGANFFSGSRFPGYASYSYSYNSTGNFGQIGAPNFTTVGTGQGFGIGWSALLPDWPTFSVSYTQGSGGGNVFGTNEESTSSTKTLNLRSSYRLAGWNLNAYYTRLDVDSQIPFFLSGGSGDELFSSLSNSVGVNGSHNLPWHGAVSIAFNHTSYSDDFNSTFDGNGTQSNYSTDNETAIVQFHPTAKLGLFVNQQYTDNLNGYLYQNIINSGGGVPLQPVNSQSNSSTVSSGATYNFLPNLYGQVQLTYFDQTYLGNSYSGSYLSGTVGYNKRILHLFTTSVTVIDSTTNFGNNAVGLVFNVNGYHNFGPWETSGDFDYAQNVQTILITYTTSYYNYGANVHRRWGRGMQWTVAVNGSHSGFNNQPGVVNSSEGVSSSLALKRVTMSGNYVQSSGQALLTSTGIQPIPPTPGLPPIGLIVYNGKSYGGAITITPLPRLFISGTYTHAASNTLSNDIFSYNKTTIFYGQFQYRLRRLSILGGFTKFSQGISASGLAPGNEYSYFIGVQRWFSFF